MAVTTITKIRTGAPAGTTATITNLNFGNTDTSIVTVTDFPITAGENSIEKYVFLNFTGVGNKVDNIQVWKSAGAYVSGESIFSSAATVGVYSQETYATPIAVTSTKATVTMPTADPTVANLGINAYTTCELTTDGDSDYWVMQLQTTAGISSGDVNTKTFTIQWDEQ